MLNEETKNEFRNLIDSYGIKKWDQKFLDKISEIVNNDNYFDNCIFIIKTNDSKCTMSTNYVNTIFENNKLIKKWIANKCEYLTKKLNLKYNDKNHHLQNENDFITQNFLLIFAFLHECSHVQQNLYAFNSRSDYTRLNTTYHQFKHYNSQDFSKIKKFIIARNYHNHHDDYFYERNANIESLKELMGIYDNNFFKDEIDYNYIKKLISFMSLEYYRGYEKKKIKLFHHLKKLLNIVCVPLHILTFKIYHLK